MIESRSDFVVGVNYPWRHYGQDFGTSAWGHRGFSSAGAEVQADFETIRATFDPYPTKVVRVFIFADGRCSPEFKENGEVAGFDEYFFPDFDVLVDSAARSGLQLIPALLDFHWLRPGGEVNGVRIGGHSDVISDPSRRESFLERALAPLLERYGRRPEIFAWDIINEPEWETRRGGFWRLSRRPRLESGSVRAFTRACASLIHRTTSQGVTLGSARPQWLRLWMETDLDLHQCHWYQSQIRLWLARLLRRERPLDRPCLVGEAPTANTRASVRDYLERAQRQGYAGLLFWSFRATDRYTDFQKLSAALQAWKDVQPGEPMSA
jgi:hypothetical protein